MTCMCYLLAFTLRVCLCVVVFVCRMVRYADISKVQDDEVGDGTTSVVVLACELLKVRQNTASLLHSNSMGRWSPVFLWCYCLRNQSLSSSLCVFLIIFIV